MELAVEKQTITICEDLKTESREHPLDCELILPDVYPDIGRILQCKGEPVVIDRSIADGTLTVQGAVWVRLIYVDEDGVIRFYRQELPFYEEFSAPEGAASATVSAGMAYLNCRAVNARKVELHGAVSLSVRFRRFTDGSVVTGAQGAGVETLTDQAEVTTLLSITEKSITVSDEIGVDAGSIHTILRSDAVVMGGECKAVTGKAVVKGDLSITALYQTPDRGCEHLRASVPFTQIVDAAGVDDQSDCTLRFAVTSAELRPRTGPDGECKTVILTAGITVTVTATKTLSLPLLRDAYSTRCGLAVRRFDGTLRRLIATVEETDPCTKQLELGREITSVLDVWCAVNGQSASCEGQSAELSGSLAVTVLALDSDNTPVVLEKTMDFHWQKSFSDVAGDLFCHPVATVTGCAYSLTGGSTMELQVDLRVCADVYETLPIDAIADLTQDASTPAEAMPAQLVIYYARSGERVFDIARRYHTAVHAVMAANDLTEPTVPAGPLLIPAAR